MTGYGTPTLLLAVQYPGEDDPAIVGLYTAAGQHPYDDENLACEVCLADVGQPPAGPYVPCVSDPAASTVTLCVPCFASQDHQVWETE
jgi:hypothetical protein